MAKKISEKDIFSGDIFEKSRKSASQYLAMLEAVQGELKEMLAINKKMVDQSTKELKTSQALKKRAEAIKSVTDASKSLEVVEREKVKTEREILKLEADNERLKQAKNRTLIQQTKEEERLAKIKAKNLKIAKQEGQAYSKMSKKLNELRNRYKNLAVQNKENTKEGRKLLKTIQQLDGRLKRIDKSVGQSQRNVGNYTSAWGKLGMRLKSVASSFGLVGGVMGAVSLVKSAFSVIADFDSAMANLGAISGATGKELESLRENALTLGESTRYTASEVAGLELELAKLGYTTPEIIASTESILALASATGTDLSQASQIAGSTLRAFNLEATEMDRVASVLGVSTTKSALNMEFLQTAMSKVAPVSSAMGFSIEDTTAILGTLANAGFDASSSATATRNILLKLADSSGDLAMALGRPITSLDDLAPALAELEAKGIDVGKALELTDKRSVSAFMTMINGTDVMVNLRDSITDVTGELNEMSDKQLDTINGQLALLNSKWQGFILGTGKSSGAVDKIKKAIGFLTRNLETIINVIIKVVKYLVIFKTTQFAVNNAMRIGRAVNIAYRVSVITMSRGLKAGTRSLRAFNLALRSNPVGLLISGLTTAVAMLWDFFGATEESTEAVEDLVTAFDKLEEAQNKAFKSMEQSSSQTLANIDLEIAKAKEQGANARDLQALQEKRLNEEVDMLSKKLDLGKQNLTTAIQENSELSSQAYRLKTNLRSQEKKIGLMVRGKDKAIEQLNTLIEQNKEEQESGKEFIKQNEEIVSDLEAQLKLKQTQVETSKINLELSIKGNEETKKVPKTLRKINIYERERNKIIKARQKLVEDIRSNELENELALINDKIEAELKLKEAESQSEEFVAMKQLTHEEGSVEDMVDLTKYNELLTKRTELENQQIRESTEFKIQQAEQDQVLYLQTLTKAVQTRKLTQAQANDLVLQSEQKLTEQIDLLRIKENEEYRKNANSRVVATEEANEKIVKSTQDTVDGMVKEQVKAEKQTGDTEAQVLQKRLQAFKGFTDEVMRQIDKRHNKEMKAINDELQASEKREDELRRLAQEGTATAEESLATEQRKQAELERQKEELEKKKMRRQAIISGLDLLSQKLSDDEPDAVTSTIRDITGLVAIIGNLPAFAEGTEFVTDGKAPKGKDKILARIDEGERIMTSNQNKIIGDMSNEQLTTLAHDYNAGMFNDIDYINPYLNKLHSPFQSNKMILNKFDELKKTIENKPMLTEVRWDEVSDMIVEKVQTKNRIEKKHQSSKGIF